MALFPAQELLLPTRFCGVQGITVVLVFLAGLGALMACSCAFLRCAQELLLLVSEAPDQEGMNGDTLERGLKLVLDSLDQTAVDVPFAPILVRPAQIKLAAVALSSTAGEKEPHSCSSRLGLVRWDPGTGIKPAHLAWQRIS